MQLEDFRAEFDYLNDNAIFMNHCGVSPFPRRCARAMQEGIKHSQAIPDDLWHRVMRKLGDTQKQLAALFNAHPSELALTMNTTQGINWVANGLDWQPGDRIISINGEYPANIYPWMRLQQDYGVDLHLIDPVDNRVTPGMIERAMTPQTRLVTLSFVDFVTGFRADIERIGELCRSTNVLFMLDLIQGAGALPIDLEKARVDFAVCGAQKWLMGPQGIGFFFCAQERLDQLRVTQLGATSIENVVPYRHYELTLRDDALRFMYGTFPTVNLYGFHASLSLFLEAGEEYIQSRIKKITDKLVDGLTRTGFTCHSPRGEGEWSGIVSFTHPHRSASELAEHLWQNHIFAREREGYLRIAPHFHNTMDEAEQLITALSP